MKKVIIFINPYTAQADYDLIKIEMTDYAKNNDWLIISEIGEINNLFSNNIKEIDIVLFWQLEHLGSSLNQLQANLSKIKKHKLDFVFVKDGLGSLSDPFLVYRTIEKLTAFASRSTRQKIKDGIDLAQAKGKRLGRPSLPYKLYKKGKELRAQGLTYKEIGIALKVDESTIRKKLSKEINNI